MQIIKPYLKAVSLGVKGCKFRENDFRCSQPSDIEVGLNVFMRMAVSREFACYQVLFFHPFQTFLYCIWFHHLFHVSGTQWQTMRLPLTGTSLTTLTEYSASSWQTIFTCKEYYHQHVETIPGHNDVYLKYILELRLLYSLIDNQRFNNQRRYSQPYKPSFSWTFRCINGEIYQNNFWYNYLKVNLLTYFMVHFSEAPSFMNITVQNKCSWGIKYVHILQYCASY